jgi:cytosine/adenosine deaminase-related metal-dependent hydrolase
MILRAQNLLPVTAPPIEDGAVVVAGDRLRFVGAWRDVRAHVTGPVQDLGETILLPGLVNAHCHLDYTHMAGLIAPPKTFTDWIGAIIAAKAGWGYADYAASWLEGARQLLHSGTTTVADIEAVPDLLPEVWQATPLRVRSFLEMTGIRAQRPAREILQETMARRHGLRHARSSAQLSPHAPYSTLPELLRRTAQAVRRSKVRVSVHVAESVQEFEMFRHATGPMHQWMARNHRDNSDCGLGSPVAHLARQGLLGENVLAIHVNCLARGDATLLGKTGTHVVHCPRSHDYFRHPPFERARLARAGVNLALGTDSLATTRKNGRALPTLDLFAEMQLLARNAPDLSPAEIIRLATINGARALGLAGQIGELTPGAQADLIALPRPRRTDPWEAVLHHSGPVSASLIAGQWAIAPEPDGIH